MDAHGHYLLKMRGLTCPILLSIAKEIWEYFLNNKIMITAEYLPSKMNKDADWESRNHSDSSEWKLDPEVFLQLTKLTWMPDIDLFASRLSHQVPSYMAWRPDPTSKATDAFQHSWSSYLPYAFPPFSLIGQVLRKIELERVRRVLLIAPTWQTQPWYATLLQLSVQDPILLPRKKNLLKNPQREIHPLLLQGQLQLAAWVVSGLPWCRKAYQNQLQTLSQIAEEKAQFLLTNRPGESGLAGVINGKMIPFTVM